MKKWLTIDILSASILYIFIIPNNPEPVKILFKLVPMLLIIYMAFSQYKASPQKAHVFILIGLIFGMLGDGLLRWFIIGLSAFLIGHLCYIISFFQQWNFSKWRAMSIIPISLYSFIIGSQVVTALEKNNNGSLMIPVIIYIMIIATMGWFAMMTNQKLIIIGAGLFLISDSLLAWNRFVDNLGGMSVLIMMTYYAAQYFIARSIGGERG